MKLRIRFARQRKDEQNENYRCKVNRRRVNLHTPFKTALRTVTEIESIDVYIHTDEGIVGKGAAAATVITGISLTGLKKQF